MEDKDSLSGIVNGYLRDKHGLALQFSRLLLEQRELYRDNRDGFKAVIREANSSFGVTPTILSQRMGVRIATTSRWISGNGSPPSYARPVVIEAVASLVVELNQPAD